MIFAKQTPQATYQRGRFARESWPLVAVAVGFFILGVSSCS